MSFPHEDQETLYRKSLNDVAKMLKSKHGENYMVWFYAFVCLFWTDFPEKKHEFN